MLPLSDSLRIFLALEPCGMCKYLNGLHNAALTRLQEDAESEPIIIFAQGYLDVEVTKQAETAGSQRR